MSSAASLPNHTFTGQAWSSKRLINIVHILSPETDNCPSWISGRERMTVENISWSISTKECCRPWRGLNPRPLGLQSDGASNWATEADEPWLNMFCEFIVIYLLICFYSGIIWMYNSNGVNFSFCYSFTFNSIQNIQTVRYIIYFTKERPSTDVFVSTVTVFSISLLGFTLFTWVIWCTYIIYMRNRNKQYRKSSVILLIIESHTIHQ